HLEEDVGEGGDLVQEQDGREGVAHQQEEHDDQRIGDGRGEDAPRFLAEERPEALHAAVARALAGAPPVSWRNRASRSTAPSCSSTRPKPAATSATETPSATYGPCT